MKKLLLVCTVTAVLALAGSASAKEVKSIAICGASGCVDVAKQGNLHGYVEATRGAAAPAVSPYYTVRATVAEGEDGGQTVTWTSYYVPSANVLAGIGDSSEIVTWMQMPERSRALFAKATAKLEPFPVPRITAAYVDGRRVAGDASTYGRLLTLPEKFAPHPSGWDWVAVDLRSAHQSPWTASDRDLVYSPSANLLERGIARVPLRESLAADVEAARALDASTPFPWLTAIVAVAASLVAAGLLVLAARRRPVRVAAARARLESP